MSYRAQDGEDYILNLIDTPGHVDFSYEVSRALQACEGAMLVVDAAQGIEAQTLANAYLAMEADLEILPVVNKIDLPAARPRRAAQEIEDVVGLDAAESCSPVSAKTGVKGVEELLERDRAARCRRPRASPRPRAARLGLRRLVRLLRGRGCPGAGDRRVARTRADASGFHGRGTEHEVQALDVIDPHREKSGGAGGRARWASSSAGIKTLGEVRIGDTVTDGEGPGRGAAARLPRGQAHGVQRALPGGRPRTTRT